MLPLAFPDLHGCTLCVSVIRKGVMLLLRDCGLAQIGHRQKCHRNAMFHSSFELQFNISTLWLSVRTFQHFRHNINTASAGLGINAS
jgi:hypothetical protein